MRKYIVDLTNNLIAKHRYDDWMQKFDDGLTLPENLPPGTTIASYKRTEFIKHVKLHLESVDVQKMNPSTLGKIICSFEDGEVLMDPKKELHFMGKSAQILRELVALGLAYLIRERLAPHESQLKNVPIYHRTPQSAV